MPSSTTNAQGRLAMAVQVVSLLATGAIVWLRVVSPRLHRYSWTTLIGSALGYAVFAYAASAVITLSLLAILPRRERGDILWNTLRTSAVAVWFAPAIILLSQFSPAGLAAALVLVIMTTRFLYSEWRRLHQPDDWEMPRIPGAMFGEADPPRPLFLKELAPALSIALVLQTGAAAGMLRAHLLAGALLAMTAAMLTVLALATGVLDTDRPQNLPRSALGVVLTILMAAGLTVGGLRGRIIRRGFPADDLAQQTPPPPGQRAEMGSGFPENSFPGVILTPEESKFTTLVAPVTAQEGLFGAKPRTFAIPFEGEYWMYRFLYRRPPPNSFQRKGTPAAFSFSTTDHWPLIMEAHQKLDQPIDLSCCTTVRVELWNADRYPGTVSLEMRVLDGLSTKSLGVEPVRSSPNLRQEPLLAVAETLEFSVPADLGMISCTELEVIFRRDQTRMDKSARIALQRFVLVPRS